jgi:hypothetical protein
MAIKTIITDGSGEGGDSAHVHAPVDGPPGLTVYTQDRRQGKQACIRYLSNNTYGIDMNQNITFGGCPVLVHNGIEPCTVIWTGSAISGTWDFNSCTQANAGTFSVDGTATIHNDEALFPAPCPINMRCYPALTGQLYLTSWPTSGTKNLEIRARLAGVCVGCAILLSCFVCCGVLNNWQSFIISNSDLGVNSSCIDELVVKNIDIGGGQPINFYMDCIQWENTGSPAEFSLELTSGTVYEVDTISIFLVDNVPSTVTNGTIPGLAYNKMLGLCALPNGINIANTANGFTTFNNTINQLGDLFQLPPVETISSGSDGTNTWIKLTFNFPKPLKYFHKKQDNLIFTINDNLSGLLQFRVALIGEEYNLVEE